MPTLEFAHTPPVQLGGIAVLLIASDNAALATDALRHIEVKAILFAGFERTRRDKLPWLDLDLHQRFGHGRKQRAFHQWQRRHAPASWRYTYLVSTTKAPLPNSERCQSRKARGDSSNQLGIQLRWELKGGKPTRVPELPRKTRLFRRRARNSLSEMPWFWKIVLARFFLWARSGPQRADWLPALSDSIRTCLNTAWHGLSLRLWSLF